MARPKADIGEWTWRKETQDMRWHTSQDLGLEPELANGLAVDS